MAKKEMYSFRSIFAEIFRSGQILYIVYEVVLLIMYMCLGQGA